MRFSAQLLAAAACLAGSVVAQTKIKIMPLGDSNTEITCWRNQVWDNLVSAGLSSRVDFVGSMSNNPQNCVAKNSNWDKNHEGHSGYRSVDIANNNLAGWLRNSAPDIVMFHLGTNDINAGTSVQTIINSFTKMVQLMRAQNSRMRIIVATLIPMNNNRAATVPQLNSAIKSWAPSQSTSASPIYVADVGTGFPVSALRDQLHPNAAGDLIFANKYSPVLIQAINSLTGGTTPPPPTTPPPTSNPPPSTPPPSTPPPSTPPPSGCSSLYGQCGGIGYSGPKCCSQGSCKFSNDWYSQCL